ncbi:UvrD-helicase domain-containing protein [Haliea sp. E17]|uniref:UvrD-helicase domain-containing protein n=1 Tax=Haliea sp. E17 TaxID=3401576 RepID=UPI003AAD66BB
MSVIDSPERLQALDTRRSFRVTAPAGSGKTELLIQRFLALLPTVARPEQVLAITFTRKAAAEMLERVVDALKAAQANVPVDSPHQQQTRDLALAALQHGRALGLELTRDIGRFNIRTIDGFCASLSQHMPVLSGFGGRASVKDDVSPLYREAVTELFSLAGSARAESADLDALLLHFDNNWDRLAGLLTSMLGKREQWLEYVETGRGARDAEQRLRQTVAVLVAEELADIGDALAPWLDRLFPLFQFAQGNLEQPVPAAFPAAAADQLESWRALGRMLLKADGDLRQKVDKRNGFPAGGGLNKANKDDFTAMLEEMGEAAPGLAQVLQRLAWLPGMDENADSWQLVLHLSHVLPLLSACLLLVFARRGVVDHTQVAVSALDALGEDDAPTELALRLDYRIEHILVDEFQDTSNLQYRLVERLTRDWAQHNGERPDNPRTLFIVGDGMQSIYGFRNANVGLFQKAAEQGFNGLLPEPLALRCNFRSEQGVVDWVNATFAEVFPAQGELRRGTVGFSPATAVRPPGAGPATDMHAFHGEDAAGQEAQWLAEQIAGALEDDSIRSIAVLGRTRAQLGPLVQQLRQRGIPFAAQDMDALANSPAVVDLLTLCRAFANPGDRLAWFALLRAPWCALELRDLRCLAEAADNLPAALLRGELPAGLSAQGRERLERVARCLQWGWEKRDRLALRVWLEQLWQYLGGPACLPDARHLYDAAHFFQLMDAAEREGVGLDPAWLEERIARLFAPGAAAEAKLQVMTLHKAKGLEFDWVIMPALSRLQRGEAREILLWDEFNARDGHSGFLLAADDHSPSAAPGLYNYLKQARREKNRHEIARLLYVGTTRAIRRLTLTATLREDAAEAGGPVELRPPAEGSLLAPIWPQFEAAMQVHSGIQVGGQEARSLPLRRLQNPPQAPRVTPLALPNLPAAARNRSDRHVGTVTHLLLEHLAQRSPLPATLPGELLALGRYHLAQAGLHGVLLEQAAERVSESLQRTLGDQRWGRWLLDAGQRDAQCELALTWRSCEGVKDIVIDRTFIDRDSGERWVIDYKSSVPGEGASLEDFLAHEKSRYLPQLQGYRDCLAQLGSEPLRCALYFTRLGLLQHLPELDT